MSAPLFNAEDTQRLLDGLGMLKEIARSDSEEQAIDRLCERLSAQGEAKKDKGFGSYEQAVEHWLDFGDKGLGTAHHGYFSKGGWAYETLKAGQPQAPEPVNAELLAAAKTMLGWVTSGSINCIELAAEIRAAQGTIARAEAALAAQKGQP